MFKKKSLRLQYILKKTAEIAIHVDENCGYNDIYVNKLLI